MKGKPRHTVPAPDYSVSYRLPCYNCAMPDNHRVRINMTVLAVTALIVSIFLNNPTSPDANCEPDPVYGGCSGVPVGKSASTYKILSNAFGLFLLESFGYFLATHDWENRQ